LLLSALKALCAFLCETKQEIHLSPKAEEYSSFDDFLARLREESRNTTQQGRKFETAIAAILPQPEAVL
jgi:predicted N-acyltransferase